MDTYDIFSVGRHGFGVDIASAAGTECIRGFPTRMAAQRWVDEQRRADCEAMAGMDWGGRAAIVPLGAPVWR